MFNQKLSKKKKKKYMEVSHGTIKSNKIKSSKVIYVYRVTMKGRKDEAVVLAFSWISFEVKNQTFYERK